MRLATLDDLPALRALIARSARELSAGDYTPAQITAALQGTLGVDTQLVRDGTYFVIESTEPPPSRIVACGGWSYRRTLFGGDARAERDPEPLDPRHDAAKVRAFFVEPAFARRGLGRALLERCETEAMVMGFVRFELMATVPGERLYAQAGYVAGERIEHPVGDGLVLPLIPMTKRAAP